MKGRRKRRRKRKWEEKSKGTGGEGRANMMTRERVSESHGKELRKYDNKQDGEYRSGRRIPRTNVRACSVLTFS